MRSVSRAVSDGDVGADPPQAAASIISARAGRANDFRLKAEATKAEVTNVFAIHHQRRRPARNVNPRLLVCVFSDVSVFSEDRPHA